MGKKWEKKSSVDKCGQLKILQMIKNSIKPFYDATINRNLWQQY